MISDIIIMYKDYDIDVISIYYQWATVAMCTIENIILITYLK